MKSIVRKDVCWGAVEVHGLEQDGNATKEEDDVRKNRGQVEQMEAGDAV